VIYRNIAAYKCSDDSDVNVDLGLSDITNIWDLYQRL